MKLWRIPFMGLLVLLLTAVPGVSIRPLHAAPQPRTAGDRSPQLSGTLIAMRSHGSASSILLRTQAGTPVSVRVTARSSVVSRDGQRLAVSDMRLGDRVEVSSSGQIRDQSQHVVRLSGVVSSAGQQPGDPLVIVVGETHGVVADLSSHMQYTDRSHETSSVTQLDDADQVQIRGVLDDALSEVTQTDSINRVGPFLHRGKKQPKS